MCVRLFETFRPKSFCSGNEQKRKEGDARERFLPFSFTFLSVYVFVLLFRLLSNKEIRKENQPGLGQVLFLFPFFGERK